ncbi:neuropeptide S receptor-like [Acipenser oxyrinchus oxyrinchus]|uniref:Neuropeptide S receptor-like n=1 Tax=Acipenser oxyrinchus oxyrinchus TaxID=40147 RepID=A0AAD8GDM0_ACIOX|nr:neuropeptide S receptor-like [Acipenser oxyrinchus oxyrinchus]
MSSPATAGNETDWSMENLTMIDMSFYTSLKTEQLVTLWVIFLVTITGNSLVLISMWRNREKKSRMTFFVTQLAIAGEQLVVTSDEAFPFLIHTDILVGLINILSDIIWRFTGNFLAPDFVCKILKYFQVVLLYASTYVLVSLSIDRYHALVHPLKFLQGEKQAKILIAVSWALSFLFSTPSLIIFGNKQMSNGEIQCLGEWPEEYYWVPYMIIVACLVFFIPLIIISVFYSIVIWTIWNKSKRQSVMFADQGDKSKVGKNAQRSLIPKAKINAVKYSVVVIFAFVMCWSPYFVFDMLDNFKAIPHTDERFFASIIIQHLTVLNSAINPFIYFIFSVKCCTPCRKSKQEVPRGITEEAAKRGAGQESVL